MVGIDENDYSDIALQWMLEELVDDGDEIVCLRVVDAKAVTDRNVERRDYQKAAKDLMERIQARNDDNRAISIILEFAVGKVHATFQKMIQLYEPAMLIVGTRGRSLGGFQGLVTNRNSFSKWCLQYSPIPVVVVRPTEKRLKKKKKRDADPTRQDYARILKESGIDEHETEHSIKFSILEASNDPDAEAHAVAAALGLPARFDPTVKPLDELKHIKKPDLANVSEDNTLHVESRSTSPTTPRKNSKLSQQLDSPALSAAEESSEGDDDEEEEEDDDEEGEFDVAPGHTLLKHDDEESMKKKQKLHVLEMQEAAALAAGRKGSAGSNDTNSSGGSGVGILAPDEDEDEDENENNDARDE